MKTKLNITFDKKFIEDWELLSVKEQAKEFKKTYTAEDLLRFFSEEIGVCVYGRPIVANVSAFADGNGHACYSVNIVVDASFQMSKVRFFVEQDGTVTNDESLWSVEVFESVA